MWSLDSAFGRVSLSSTVARMPVLSGSRPQSSGSTPRLGDWLSFMEGETLDWDDELPEAGDNGRNSTGERRFGVLNAWTPPEPSGWALLRSKERGWFCLSDAEWRDPSGCNRLWKESNSESDLVPLGRFPPVYMALLDPSGWYRTVPSEAYWLLAGENSPGDANPVILLRGDTGWDPMGEDGPWSLLPR